MEKRLLRSEERTYQRLRRNAMSDLISRKALISVFEEQKQKTTKLHELLFFDAVMAIIDNQPTAYDVDKVVEQLDKIEKINNEKEHCNFTEGYGCAIDNAIDIVKGAVKDE